MQKHLGLGFSVRGAWEQPDGPLQLDVSALPKKVYFSVGSSGLVLVLSIGAAIFALAALIEFSGARTDWPLLIGEAVLSALLALAAFLLHTSYALVEFEPTRLHTRFSTPLGRRDWSGTYQDYEGIRVERTAPNQQLRSGRVITSISPAFSGLSPLLRSYNRQKAFDTFTAVMLEHRDPGLNIPVFVTKNETVSKERVEAYADFFRLKVLPPRNWRPGPWGTKP